MWLSLTLGGGAARLVPCGKIWTGVVQSYTGCTFLICPGQASPWGGVEWPAALPHGSVLSLCFSKQQYQHCSLDLGITFAELLFRVFRFPD